MNTLFVGGPMHGTKIPVDDETMVKVFGKEEDNLVYEYIRHANGPLAGDSQILFMLGEAKSEEVIDAIRKSELGDTGKHRAISAAYSYVKVGGDATGGRIVNA